MLQIQYKSWKHIEQHHYCNHHCCFLLFQMTISWSSRRPQWTQHPVIDLTHWPAAVHAFLVGGQEWLQGAGSFSTYSASCAPCFHEVFSSSSSFGFSRQGSPQRIFYLHCFPIFCIPLHHFNHCNVLSHRIRKHPPRPYPLPLLFSLQTVPPALSLWCTHSWSRPFLSLHKVCTCLLITDYTWAWYVTVLEFIPAIC